MGTVVSLYPGTVYGEQILQDGFEESSGANNEILLPPPTSDYVITCGGSGYLLDAGAYVGKDILFRFLQKYPFAHGHIAQHPPGGVLPSLLEVPVDFDLSIFPHRDIPYTFSGQNNLLQGSRECAPSTMSGGTLSQGGLVIPGLAMMLTKDVYEGEELYLDYCYGDIHSWPSWYTPVPPSARWSLLNDAQRRSGLALELPREGVDQIWRSLL